MNNKILTVGSLYAGVGGIDKAFIREGYNVLWANEIDKFASMTYRANIPDGLIEANINDVSLNDLPRVDVITAGFPCQPFSVAGNKLGLNDHRGSHMFKVIEAIATLDPQAVLLENVPNFASFDSGKVLGLLRSELIKLGYSTHFKVLNSSTHANIPQNRSRFFLVAFNKYVKFSFPSEIPLTTKISDIVETTVDSKYHYTDKSKFYAQLKSIDMTEGAIYARSRTNIRENKKGLCHTLTALMGTGGNNAPIIRQGDIIRKLSPFECFKLQGYSDIKFPKIADSHLYKQAGNSVTVALVQRIANAMGKVINS